MVLAQRTCLSHAAGRIVQTPSLPGRPGVEVGWDCWPQAFPWGLDWAQREGVKPDLAKGNIPVLLTGTCPWHYFLRGMWNALQLPGCGTLCWLMFLPSFAGD